MVEKRKLTTGKIAIYLVLFFAIWSVRELYIRPVFLNQLDGIAWQIAEASMKLLVWTLPAILLIKHFEDDMWIGLKEMFTNKPKWFKGAPILLLVFFPLIHPLVVNGGLSIRTDFQPVPSLLDGLLFNGIIGAGLTEELVFRGFLLNAFLKKMRTIPAIVLNEVLFVLIHYPIWIYFGFNFTEILFGVQIFFVGAFFSYSFIKTKNIFVPMALHIIWNLLILLFGVY
jgi:membrane protease YdiL (CAAX protease family)